MTERAEDILNAGCQLVKRGTHEVWRRPDDSKVFVKDTDLQFNFSDSNALTQASETAREANDAPDGCSTCPLYPTCFPSPTVISDAPARKLIPAQLTSFE